MKRDMTERMEEMLVESGVVQAYANIVKKPLDALLQEGPLRPLKLLLNGTLLEHPLHPLLTDVPIGAWTVGMLLDLVNLVSPTPGLGTAAAIALGFGVLAAFATIATGLSDWIDLGPSDMNIGVVHGSINSTATLLIIVSLFMRFGANWQTSLPAFAVALAGYVLVMAGGFIGGSLVFRRGVMVNRNAFGSGPDDFVTVIALDKLPEAKPTRVAANDQPVVLFRQGEAISALGAICSHMGGDLSMGKVERGQIMCPLHYSRFALADGSVKAGPATAPVPAYETRVRDGQVQVRLKK